ncbi:alpha/beta hydrolase [Dermacoccus abyssi]|uniref:alpha/beta fold hydrolase n=1 Tax=Dermacoccus abyssi TaxID=322596 RepID=UPI0021A30587|nr:alpha/beta hydrolase [Dermacoccus abyssi]
MSAQAVAADEKVQGENVTVRRVRRGTTQARVTTLKGPAGRDFVLLAGIGVASNYYVRLAADLNTTGSVHAIDLPGFGGVRHRDRALDIGDFAEIAGAVIDDLGLDDPVVIGHSMGAQVATELAARRPELTSLVLIGPVIDADARTIPQQILRLAHSALYEPGAVRVLVGMSYAMCGPRWILKTLPRMMRYRIEEHIGAVQADTLIVRGDHDANCPREWAERLVELVPRGRAVEVDDAAHSVMYRHAHEVAKLCLLHDGGEEAVRELEPPSKPRHPAMRVRGVAMNVAGMVRGDDALIARGIVTQRHATDMAD